MCVILVCDTHRPSETAVKAAYEQNPSGAGIAWQDGKGKVKWKKGLTVGEIVNLTNEVPLPFVAHFRIPTCGGDIPGLTHPFTIDKKASTALEGETDGMVLFHNGHWTGWKNVSLETSVRGSLKLPEGRLSDSRMMAWCASIYGPSFLELIDEKIVSLAPEGEPEIYGNYTTQGNTGWSVFENMWVSNRHFISNIHKFEARTYSRPEGETSSLSRPFIDMTKPFVRPHGNQWDNEDPVVEVFLDGKAPKEGKVVVLGPTKAATGGAADPATFRGGSQAEEGRKDQQQEVQEGQVGLYQGPSGNTEGSNTQGSQGRGEEDRADNREGEGRIVQLRSLVTGKLITPFVPPRANEDAINWVRSLNPPRRWGSFQTEDIERTKRLGRAAAGISNVL